jgi:hypothetical protein
VHAVCAAAAFVSHRQGAILPGLFWDVGGQHLAPHLGEGVAPTTVALDFSDPVTFAPTQHIGVRYRLIALKVSAPLGFACRASHPSGKRSILANALISQFPRSMLSLRHAIGRIGYRLASWVGGLISPVPLCLAVPAVERSFAAMRRASSGAGAGAIKECPAGAGPVGVANAPIGAC